MYTDGHITWDAELERKAIACAENIDWSSCKDFLSDALDEIARLRADNRFLEAIVVDTHHGKDFRKRLHWIGGEDGCVAQADDDL